MAGLKTITQFKSQLRGGGARPNLFEVDITNFGGGTGGDTLGFTKGEAGVQGEAVGEKLLGRSC